MRMFTIKQFSQLSGLSQHTLRYYEKISLLEPVSRNASGYREYSEDHLRQVEFLNRLRNTGMPIKGMLEYVGLRQQGTATLQARRELLERHEEQVHQQLDELAHNLEFIRSKIGWYKKEEQNTIDKSGGGCK